MRQFERTSTKVTHVLHQNGPMTIAEIADVLFVDESNIRRAIYKLIDSGVVRSIGKVEKDKAGRPGKLYVNLSASVTPSPTTHPTSPAPSACA